MDLVISSARLRDAGVFLDLWMDYLKENHAQGSEVIPSETSLRYYMRILERCISDPLCGAALLAREGEAPIGVLLWADPQPEVETSWGKFAMGFGTYVAPSHRRTHVATELRRAGLERLRAAGFETLVGSSVARNDAGYHSGQATGLVLHGHVGVLRLH